MGKASKELHLLRAESLEAYLPRYLVRRLQRSCTSYGQNHSFVLQLRVLFTSFKGAAPLTGRITLKLAIKNISLFRFKGAAPLTGRITLPPIPQRTSAPSFKGAAPLTGRITPPVNGLKVNCYRFKGAAPLTGRITAEIPVSLLRIWASKELHLLRAESLADFLPFPDELKLQRSCTSYGQNHVSKYTQQGK